MATFQNTVFPSLPTIARFYLLGIAGEKKNLLKRSVNKKQALVFKNPERKRKKKSEEIHF